MTELMINHFTHTDLDGVGCAVLIHLFARQNDASIAVEYCDRGKNMNIDDRVNRFLDSLDMAHQFNVMLPSKRYVIISDISINDQTAARLNSYRSDKFEILMVDHHPPAAFVQLCPWAVVNTDETICATSLLYEALQPEGRFVDHRLKGNWAIDAFVRDVQSYDTWAFDEGDNAYYMNILLGSVGQESFQTIASSWLVDSKPFFLEYTPYWDVVTKVSAERKAYCRRKLSGVQRLEWQGYRLGVVFGEKCISQLADTILEACSDIDICAVILPGSVSLRTKKSDINLGEIAARMGGGGHQKAAAYMIDKPNEDMIRTIMNLQEETTIGKETY